MADDRLTLLLHQSAVTGIDFVQVVDPEDQTVLRVHFLSHVWVILTERCTVPDVDFGYPFWGTDGAI